MRVLDLADLLLDLLLRVEAELLLHVVQLLALRAALVLLSLDTAHERRPLLLELVDLALVLIKLRADLIASLEVLLLASRLRVDLVVDRLQLLLQSVDGGLRLLVVRIKSGTIRLRNLRMGVTPGLRLRSYAPTRKHNVPVFEHGV